MRPWNAIVLVLALAVAGAANPAPAQDAESGTVPDTADVARLLQLPASAVGNSEAQSEELVPAYRESSRAFHASRRTAHALLAAQREVSTGGKPREKALMDACASVLAGSYFATLALTRTNATPLALIADARKMHIALSKQLSEEPQKRLAEARKPQTFDNFGLFASKDEAQKDELAGLYPWFDRDLAFLALTAGSAYALARGPRAVPREALGAAMHAFLDSGGGKESFREWAAEQCARFMFLGSEHVDYVRVSVADSTERDTPDGRFYRGSLRLTNIGARRLVGSALLVMLSDDPAPDTYEPGLEHVSVLRFDLAPLARQSFNVDIVQKKHGNRIARFLSIGDSGPISAIPLGPAMNINTCTERALSGQVVNPFIKVLATYAADAPDGFKNLADGEPDSMLRQKVKLAVPGARAATIRDVFRWKSLEATVYQGSSAAEARRSFDGLMATLRASCGDKGGELDKEPGLPGYLVQYTIQMFSPRAQLQLALRKVDEKGSGKPDAYEVHLAISPHVRLFP